MEPGFFQALAETEALIKWEQLKKRNERKYYRKMKRMIQYEQSAPKRRYTKKRKQAKLPRLGRKGLPKEKKFLDTTTFTFPTYTSSSSQGNTQLTNMAAGTASNQIVGDSALLKSAGVNITITCAATTTGSATYRVILVYGKTATSLFTGVNTINELQNMDFTEENVVLYDKMKSIDATSNRAISFRCHKKLNHLYHATAGWDVYCLIKTTGTLATAAPTTTAWGRVTYYDD